jgi:hypothetical protein
MMLRNLEEQGIGSIVEPSKLSKMKVNDGTNQLFQPKNDSSSSSFQVPQQLANTIQPQV